MTQTNTDYLLQLTTAVTDRAYGSSAVNDGAGKFDDHLSQAATFSGDDSNNRGSSSQRTETTRYERDDRSRSTGDSKPSDPDSNSSPSSQTSPADCNKSVDAVSESEAAADDDGDEHDTDASDDTTAAEVAGAGQTATGTTKKTESKTNSDSAAAAIATAVNKQVVPHAGDPNATGKADDQANSGTPSLKAATQQADEAAKLAVDTTTGTDTTSEQVDESQAAAADGKRSNAAKGESSTAKSNKGARTNGDGTASDRSSVEGVEVVQTIDGEVKASAALADATTDKSDSDEPSDDDSRSSSQNEVRAGVRNDASALTNKIDAAQLVGSLPNSTDVGADTSSKGKDGERATEPIAAKGEPVAAAFARMTRNSMTGPNDSAPGANDLPQVDPSRFIGRVAKAFQTAQDRGGKLQLRLSPPELGALRIELSVKDGVMSASLQTENANARRLLLDHLPVLRDRLAEQNIRVDRFDVDVRRDGADGQTDARGSQQQQFQHQPDQPAPRRQVQSQSPTRQVAAPERIGVEPSIGDTGLNLIV